MSRSQVKAEDYRCKARNASAMAEASTLDRVREKHELAAATWREMAESQECRDRRRFDLLFVAAQSCAVKRPGQADDEAVPCTA